ncbi:uncharacterized protein LOC135488021 [Lineus longissimus]|uniref:uncharacterized protein LOC135488021 n=1 Tax=Lineus longissimus TaxID=88925 RepID=UPI002B4DD25B
MKTFIAFFLLVVACRAYDVPDPMTIAQKNWTFIPRYPWSPTVQIGINYHSPNYEYIYCCQRYSNWGRYITISPLSKVIYRPIELRQKPLIYLNWQMPSSLNVAKNYTLVMVDPDTPRAGARDFPRIHWIVANLNMRVNWKNDTLASYSGPLPPDQKPHHYVFLLYEQNLGRVVNATAMNESIPASRSLFNVQDFTSRFSLTLKGISWFQALNDEYVNYTKIMRNPASEPMYCAGKYMWSQHGCMVHAGTDKISMSLTFLIICFVALVKLFN